MRDMWWQNSRTETGEEEVIPSGDEQRSEAYEGGGYRVGWLFARSIVSADDHTTPAFGAEEELEKATHDLFLLLDTNSTTDISTNLKRSTHNHDTKVTGSIPENSQIDLPYQWQGIYDREDDRKC